MVLVARYCVWSQGGGTAGAGGGTFIGLARGAGIGCGGGGLPQPLHAVAATATNKPEICIAAMFMIRLTSSPRLFYNAIRGAAIPRRAPGTKPTPKCGSRR
jgi:hypothetical protein